MRWLCLHLPRFPLQCLQPAPEKLAAVIDQRGSRRCLIVCDDDCSAHGITAGLDAATALACNPELRLLPRSRRQERVALRALVGWSGQFSSCTYFEADRLLLWMEIGSSLRYFGGLDPLLQRVRKGLDILGYDAGFGVGPNPEAAALMARLGNQPAITTDELQQRLAPLPIQALSLSSEIIEALQASGLRSIGDVLALPAEALARRFGPECVGQLRRLTGEIADPRTPHRMAQTYRRRFELNGTVESSQALLFPLRRILGELEGFLRGRDAAIRKLHIRFRHEDHPSTELVLRASRPMRDAVRLYALLRERLERFSLIAGTDEIDVHAPELMSLGDTQLSLLEGAGAGDDGWSELLDRMRARLGDAAVRGLGLRNDHRPERAWCTSADMAAGNILDAERPLWLLRPQELQTLPQVLGDPERIEAGWWDGCDSARDYYRAQTPTGSQLWLYRERDSRRWYLHGLWA